MNSQRCIVLLAALFLSACTVKNVEPVVETEVDRLKAEIELYQKEAEKKQRVKSEVARIRLENSRNQVSPEQYRFDVKTDKLEANLFFMNLMAGTSENIVLHPNVSGAISLNLSNVSLREVLDVVRDIYGFDYEYKNSIYTVFPKSLRTEIFPINYINVKRVGVSDTSVLTGNVESTAQTASKAASGSGETSTINPGSRIQTRSETDFWTSLNKSLSQLIGVSNQSAAKQTEDSTGLERKVVTNPQTGVAIVTAMPNELAAVRKFLDRASLSVKRQVIIEAKILEIQLSDSHQTGVNWNAINGQLLLGRNVSSFDSSASISDVSEDVGEVFSSLVRISDIGTLLSLLKEQGEMQVLSSPRVSTVNNQKAVIRVGSDQFFVTGISSSTVSNASSTTSSPDIELSSFFSGISLDVTPQISSEGGVILHIHPVISTVTEEQKNIVVGDETFSLPLALRDIRESDSIVKAENGQVIVLGGLMQERISLVKGKRPGLSEVPAAGKLFKKEVGSRVKSELVILLKPIVVDQDSWVDDFNKTQERFNRIHQTSSADIPN